MANKKNSKKGRTTRRPTKAELERQKAIRRMLVTFGVAFLLLFAALKWGAVGITLYNLIRLLVGSLAYMAIIASLIYLFFFKWVNKHEGYKSGFFSIFIGLLLIFQAYFVNVLNLKGQVLSTTLSRILTDLTAVKVSSFAGGGLLGAALYTPVAFLFSNIGSYFIGVLLILLGALLISPYSIYDIFEKISEAYHAWNEKREAKRQQRFVEKEEKAAQEAMSAIQVEQDELQIDPETGEILDDDVLAHTPIQFEEGEPEIYDYDEGITEKSHEEDQQDDIDEDVEVNFTPKESFDYKLPTINLFAPDKPKNQSKEKKIVRENIKILEETFTSFGIRAAVERAEIGPSVTKYEVKPAVGVRVNRISNLADDLALALAAKDVRIEAPIPGKSLVGIEVPNSEIATVTFRELWEQSKTDDKKLLEIPLGKAVNGSVRTFDLAKMPHLLVAGSTGSGKSVAVNGIIASILMKARPDEVKFMMVDPKMVELSVYNDIPHLLIPVVTNPRKASRALQKVVDEMENRYELFSKVGARNIAGYNAKVAEYNASQPEYKQVPLPLIVVIVDELADLMMVASKEVEDAIIRLGQKARAAGIHMILATQRPSVDVISGLIKANVPSRIAFAVSSGTDSRTILDENGAEKLLGRGDMLFKPIDENHPVRLQGSFISDEDVERIVTFVKNQAEADYDDNFDPGEVSENDMDSGSESEQGDPLFEEAKALVIETQKASASMLQRRLSVGFNRATRLMEELEAAGVIGPAEGTKPRKVLLNN
ncbi:DNA translocase FtsK [Streptococcus anginosus]|uniref:DNA translocase FtsK n=1 Tax=Streptococcus anginosus TaxID=1328 RepID=A0A3S4QRG5_STRAP|nr:DNA translocase FtsK [Streptococcus anginosus]GAD40279.1 DNA segregation ATPase FtsK/SpoIIIE [Streptococcus intermedius SK54 = ATCC 27335]EGL45757.1 FtsK/SpoIIIE family protein [Streptococcus anginosus SK52 = DSM 20563]MBX9101634.1 DNA translocase FtsK [Streptococcus anginosus]MBZ2156721.1 DNA translocase FtsK [Streptococcus anginosus]ORE83258.1 DNA translocase FtsK [Streptococcus anginosus SK52 = DSM 20563]